MAETNEILLDAVFDEGTQDTEARVTMQIAGREFVGLGRARRNPEDPNVPVVGEELALARALNDLSHKLVEAAADRIEEFEGHPVSVHV